MIIPNSKPPQVTFSTKLTKQDSAVAATQISKATQVRLAALDAHDNANFRLQKATESLKATEVAYHEALAKNAWNAEELRKAYSNALLGFRDADKAAQAAAAEYTVAKNALESLNLIAKNEFSTKKNPEPFTPVEKADDKKMPWEDDSSEDSSNADDSSAPAKKSVSPFHFNSLLQGESNYPTK